MSTKIKDTFEPGNDFITIMPQTSVKKEVHITTRQGENYNHNVVSRAEFEAAYAAEFDVVITPKDTLPVTLPEVRQFSNGEISVGGVYRTVTKEFNEYPPEAARETAARLLALADFLENPPVDQAQVEALAGLLHSAVVQDRGAARDLAEHVLASGKVSVTL